MPIKKLSFLLLIFTLVLLAAAPIMSQAANFIYDSTVTGLGVEQVGTNQYQIISRKTTFTSAESVWVLSKLTNIQGINTFRLRHDILTNGTTLYRSLFSPTYYPNNSFWSVTYSWNEFGRLPAGNHLVKVYISVNGGTYQEVDSKSIIVIASQPHYSYDYTKTGTGVEPAGGFDHRIVGEKTTFITTESVWVLTKLSDIYSLGAFRLRHDILTSSSTLYRSLLSPTYSPNQNFWATTYSWNEFGPLPADNYQIKIYLSLDGGVFQEIGSMGITVQPAAKSYNLEYTKLGLGVLQVATNQYQIIDEKYTFAPTESVWVLNKLTGIQGIKTFRLRYDFLADGTSILRSLYSPTFTPDHNFWAVTYTWSEFGPLPAGSHELKVFISLDGGTYQEIDSKDFTVQQPANQYTYVSTDTGLGIQQVGTSTTYQIVNGKTTFTTAESVWVLSKLANIQNVNYFSIRHDLLASSTTLYKRLTSPTYTPSNSFWSQTYSWNEFGILPAGDYQFKVFVSVNGGDYIEVGSKNIVVQ